MSPWGVRVRAIAAGGTTAYARSHAFEVGAALPFDVEGSRVTALEYLLGALGGDLIGGFRTLARQRRLAIDEIEATVDATLDNPLTHLGVVGEEGHPGLERVAIRVHVGDPRAGGRGARGVGRSDASLAPDAHAGRRGADRGRDDGDGLERLPRRGDDVDVSIER